MAKKVLFAVTSHNELGNTGKPTGFWAEEFASPYYLLADKGVEITIASPKGGKPPVDPGSAASKDEVTVRFLADEALQTKLDNTLKLSEVNSADYLAICYPGGHGPVFDLAVDEKSIQLIQEFTKEDKPVGALCHGPSVFGNVKIDGKPFVQGKKVTGFTNAEEEVVGLTKVLPFLLEDRFKEQGGLFESSGQNFKSHVVRDGKIVTGQNPQSSAAFSEEFFALL